MGVVRYPMGPATKLSPAHAAVHNITIENTTFLKLTGLTAAIEVNLTAAEGLEVGTEVHIDVVQGATGRNVNLNTGIVAPDLTGVNLDRDTILLKWNGVEFIGGAWAKVFDAA